MTMVQDSRSLSINTAVIYGVAAGLVGGAVFGVQMATMNMLPMVAGLVGSSDVVLGFIVHMLISAVIGGTFGVIASRLPSGLPLALVAGAVYGIVWWVLGALVIMPLMLGMGEMVFQINEMSTMSLVGHLVFGIVMGVVFSLSRR